MLEEFSQSPELYDRSQRRYDWRFISLASLFVLMTIGWYFLYTYNQPVVDLSHESVDVPVTGETNYAFSYVIVPDAATRISVDTLADTPEQKQQDADYYKEIQTKLQNGEIASATSNPDSPYMLGVAPIGILTMLENHEMRETLFQIHDELIALAKMLNQKNQRETPKDRGVADDTFLPYEAALDTVAPSLHIILGLYFADIMKSETPPALHAAIDTDNKDYIDRGISYGLYAKSDIAPSVAVYESYKRAALERHPELATIFNQQ